MYCHWNIIGSAQNCLSISLGLHSDLFTTDIKQIDTCVRITSVAAAAFLEKWYAVKLSMCRDLLVMLPLFYLFSFFSLLFSVLLLAHVHWQPTNWPLRVTIGDEITRTQGTIPGVISPPTTRKCKCYCLIVSLVSSWYPPKDPGTSTLWVSTVKFRVIDWFFSSLFNQECLPFTPPTLA